MIFCTSICANYLPKARLLASSIKSVMPESKVILCLVEKDIPVAESSVEIFDDVVLAKDLYFENFESFIFRHSIVEASTAVKGNIFKYLLKKYNNENKFIYLDPDIYVYSRFEELEDLLDVHSIILTPHLLHAGNIDMEISSLAHGCYNLGFLAISRAENSEKFIQWWSDRLFDFCYDDIPRGIFTDQRWIDLAPCFFDVFILKHEGYNFATWSLLNAVIENKDRHMINNYPIRFIHFSGTDSGTVKYAIDSWLFGESKNIFSHMYEKYISDMNFFDYDNSSKISWSYNNYNSGEKINLSARIAYRKYPAVYKSVNPFSLSNARILYMQKKLRISFLDSVKKLFIYSKNNGIRKTTKKIFEKVRVYKWQ